MCKYLHSTFYRRDAMVLAVHIIPVLVLAVMVNIPKFLESEVDTNENR